MDKEMPFSADFHPFLEKIDPILRSYDLFNSANQAKLYEIFKKNKGHTFADELLALLEKLSANDLLTQENLDLLIVEKPKPGTKKNNFFDFKSFDDFVDFDPDTLEEEKSEITKLDEKIIKISALFLKIPKECLTEETYKQSVNSNWFNSSELMIKLLTTLIEKELLTPEILESLFNTEAFIEKINSILELLKETNLLTKNNLEELLKKYTSYSKHSYSKYDYDPFEPFSMRDLLEYASDERQLKRNLADALSIEWPSLFDFLKNHGLLTQEILTDVWNFTSHNVRAYLNLLENLEKNNFLRLPLVKKLHNKNLYFEYGKISNAIEELKKADLLSENNLEKILTKLMKNENAHFSNSQFSESYDLLNALEYLNQFSILDQSLLNTLLNVSDLMQISNALEKLKYSATESTNINFRISTKQIFDEHTKRSISHGYLLLFELCPEGFSIYFCKEEGGDIQTKLITEPEAVANINQLILQGGGEYYTPKEDEEKICKEIAIKNGLQPPVFIITSEIIALLFQHSKDAETIAKMLVALNNCNLMTLKNIEQCIKAIEQSTDIHQIFQSLTVGHRIKKIPQLNQNLLDILLNNLPNCQSLFNAFLLLEQHDLLKVLFSENKQELQFIIDHPNHAYDLTTLYLTLKETDLLSTTTWDRIIKIVSFSKYVATVIKKLKESKKLNRETLGLILDNADSMEIVLNFFDPSSDLSLDRLYYSIKQANKFSTLNELEESEDWSIHYGSYENQISWYIPSNHQRHITDFFEAIKQGDLQKVSALVLENDIDVNSIYLESGGFGEGPETESTPLILAIQNKHYPIAYFLIEKGASINLVQDNPIIYIARYGNMEMLRHLVQKGGDINAVCQSYCNINYSLVPNNFGALHEAASGNHREAVEFLLENNADINKRLPDILGIETFKGIRRINTTPIENVVLSKKGTTSMLEYLIESGADQDSQEQSLCLSIEENRLEMVQFLLQKGVNINCQNGEVFKLLSRKNPEEKESLIEILKPYDSNNNLSTMHLSSNFGTLFFSPEVLRRTFCEEEEEESSETLANSSPIL